MLTGGSCRCLPPVGNPTLQGTRLAVSDTSPKSNLWEILMSSVQTFAERVITSIEKVIVGKRATVELAVASLLCQGHLLIEDVPGVGKTMLARSIARSLG